MRIDAYTHFIPAGILAAMDRLGAGQQGIGKRMRGIPCIYDLDARLKMLDAFPDYAQIIAYSSPPMEDVVAPERTEEFCRIINDGLAEIVDRHGDRFPGFVAQVSLADVEGAVREARRAIDDLGACGVQIYTNVNGRPIDLPELEPFWDAVEQLDKPVWIHPARRADFPDYQSEDKSLYEIWWTFGWSYETAAMMARLVFSKLLDRHPRLKPIVHHFGGIVPMLEGRIGPGWDLIGTRTSDADYASLKASLKKRPLDYFRESFFPDTAVFSSRIGTQAGLAFYPKENILFATDCPFDPEKGPGFIRDTQQILDSLDLPQETLDLIYFGNIQRITGKTFVR